MLDVVIIGAGPAGLTALLYAQLYGLTSRCFGDVIGGKLIAAPEISDYPGILAISGKEFIGNLIKQIPNLEQIILMSSVTQITKSDNNFTIKLTNQQSIQSKTCLIATGNGRKQKFNSAALFANQLGVKVQKGLIEVDDNFKTYIPGVFACGDCLTYPRSTEQLSQAVSTAISAIIHIYEFLKNESPDILWGKAKIKRF